ncbi:MAG: YerC/YecD family TrpR-related protein [Alphaproteobacteria bacterium]|nr:YerC/YecD family TrpR-related protein [Alphaproteobacteria bacterium]
MTKDQTHTFTNLITLLSHIQSSEKMERVLKDICTPKELSSLQERWQVAQLLSSGLSYREVHAKCGSSLTTITRVARFLNVESNQGYKILLETKQNLEK